MQTDSLVYFYPTGKESYEKIQSRRFKKLLGLCFLILILLSGFISKSQTTLTSVDIAIVGMNTTNRDKFSFVLIKDITSNAVIQCTDDRFTVTNVSGRTGKTFLSYTSPTNQTVVTVMTPV